MYLFVFIYSVEGVGPRNVRPIKTLGPSVLIGFPTCLSDAENSALITEINYILKYIQIESSYFK